MNYAKGICIETGEKIAIITESVFSCKSMFEPVREITKESIQWYIQDAEKWMTFEQYKAYMETKGYKLCECVVQLADHPSQINL